MDIKPISTLIKWFLPLLIESDETTYSAITKGLIKGSKKLSVDGAAIVIALWTVIKHRFTMSTETHGILLNQEGLALDAAKSRFFEKFEEIFYEDERFAITLDYLYHSCVPLDEYVSVYISSHLPGDVSTDAPPPEKKKRPKG